MLNTRSQRFHGKRSVGEQILVNIKYDMIGTVPNTMDILLAGKGKV